MTLSLQDRYVLAHPADAVWPRLSNIEFVAECFPGAALEEQLPDGGHSGSLAMRLGPTKARFAGVVHIELDDAGRTATLRAQGSDSRRSMASADATVRLDSVDTTSSAIAVDVVIEISGPLGQFARAGGAAVTRTLLTDFAGNVDARLAADASTAITLTAEPTRRPVAAPATESPPQRSEMSLARVLARSAWSGLRHAIARLRGKLSTRRGRQA